MNATALFALDKFINEEFEYKGIDEEQGYILYTIGDDDDLLKLLVGDEVYIEVNNIPILCKSFAQIAKIVSDWRKS